MNQVWLTILGVIHLAATIKKLLNVGNILKKLRLETGQNQTRFAEKLGISRSTYSNYENGNRVPDIETLMKIAKILDIPLKALLGLDDVSLFRRLEDDTFYDITKEIYLKKIKEDKYSFNDIAEKIGFKAVDIKEFLGDPFIENYDMYMALGRFLMFTDDELLIRIETDAKYLSEAPTYLINRYKVSSERYINEIEDESRQIDNSTRKISPEIAKQARDIWESFYTTTKKNNDSLEPNEKQVLDKFRLLNEVGQQEGIKRVDELGQIEKYKRKSNEDRSIKEESTAKPE